MFDDQLQKAGYKIVQSDDQSAVFSNNNKLFAVVASYTGLTVYRIIQHDNGDFEFLPGHKEGKSFRTVTRFVTVRSQ